MNFTAEKNSNTLLHHKIISGKFTDLEELNTLIPWYYSESHFWDYVSNNLTVTWTHLWWTQRSEVGIKPGSTFKHCSGNSYQEVVAAQEKTIRTCLSLSTVVCWACQVISPTGCGYWSNSKLCWHFWRTQQESKTQSPPIPKHQAMKLYWEGEVKFHAFLTLAVNGVENQHHALANLPSRKRSRYPLFRKLGGPHTQAQWNGNKKEFWTPHQLF